VNEPGKTKWVLMLSPAPYMQYFIGEFDGYTFKNDNTTAKIYQDIDATLTRQKNNGYKLYWIACGKDDFLYKFNKEYRDKLDKMGMKYVYRESEGGHTWRNWRA
jgi:enterochelin esterase family protein